MDYTCVLLEYTYKEAGPFIGEKKILQWIPYKWAEKLEWDWYVLGCNIMAGFCK
jgi:hypothetical protein